MSTACLLNPTIRRSRARRRDAIRDLRNQAYAERGPTQLQLRAVVAKLESVRKNPNMPGWFKEQLFYKIVGRFYTNVHKFATQAEERRQVRMIEERKKVDKPFWQRLKTFAAKRLFGRK